MKRAIILMTALVPTVGHQYLISFARNFLEPEDELHVIISTRSHEPTTFLDRVSGLSTYNVCYHEHNDNDAPQNPPDGDQAPFWDYWKDICEDLSGGKVDLIFASENYGFNMAEVLEARYIPVDHNREIQDARGTHVRRELFKNQNQIAHSFRPALYSDIVIFGAESCGKTTTAKHLATLFNGSFVHEWARPYLETVGADLNEQKMLDIVHGQAALEKSVYYNQDRRLINFYDTDLLSTLGYYKINGMTIPSVLFDKIKQTRFDKFYYIMDTNIPFVEDQLRYGGDVRESDTQFWVDLAEDQELPYYLVKSSDLHDRLQEISEHMLMNLPRSRKPEHKYRDIIQFARD